MSLAYFFEGDARDLPPGNYVESLRKAVGEWQEEWYADKDIPELRLEQVGPAMMLKDTRRIAAARWRVVDDVELAVLEAVRDPVAVSGALAQLDKLGSGHDYTAAFERLAAARLIAVCDGKALSLVISGRPANDAVTQDERPWGYVEQSVLDRRELYSTAPTVDALAEA